MIRFIVAALLAFAFFAAPASAATKRHHHGHGHAHHVKSHKHRARHWHGHRKPPPVPARVQATGFAAPASGLVAVAERYIGSNPTGWAHVWCARFLNAVVLPALGVRGTGDDRAISFARWGLPAGPRPGAVAVFAHHVTLVVRVNGDGTFDGLGGNQGHRVSVGRYPVAQVVAWRAPA